MVVKNMMEGKIIVLDSFFAEPDLVREFALKQEYENERVPNYPGFQSVERFLSKVVIAKLEAAIGARIDLETCAGSMGYFRYILANGRSRLKVHTDLYDWTVVIYLSPYCPAQLGTTFYRHLRTGLYGPPCPSVYDEFGFKDFQDYEKKVVEADTLNEKAWEIAGSVENRYNRCLIFKASELFHSHTGGHGTHKHDARLTQNFFFNQV
jgi:hypothetical protein